MSFFKFLMSLFLVLSVYATTFRPLPLKEHINESGAIIHGRVDNIASVTMPDGRIATVVDLRLENWVGLEQVESTNVQIHYPGGTVNNYSYQIDGSPRFELGETVVVLLKKQGEDWWVSNLGLSKYSVKRMGNLNILVNQIYPEHPTIGQIEIKKFFNYVERLKNTTVTTVSKDKYERETASIVAKNGQVINSRKLASLTGETENSEKQQSDAWWILALLGFLGSLMAILRQRKNGP